MASRSIRIQGRCLCGNNDPYKFYYIRGECNLWGICCKRESCGSEYLLEAFTGQEETFIVVNSQRLYYNSPVRVSLDPEFHVGLSHEHIVNIADLRPGDHVGFKRGSFSWHHAVVVEVQVHPFRLVISHWDGSYSQKKQMREVDQNELRHMHKFNYPHEIERGNPPHLVLARFKSRLHPCGGNAGCARPWVLGKTSEQYGFFDENCEHFTLYCKTGGSSSMQSNFLWVSIKERGKAFCENPSYKAGIREFLSTVAPQTLENMVQFVLGVGSPFLFEGIGLISVVGAELYHFLQAHRMLQGRLQKKQISREEYHTELGQKLVEFLLMIIIAGGGRLVLACFHFPLLKIVMVPVLFLVAKGASYLVKYVLGHQFLGVLGRKWEWVGQKISDGKTFLVNILDHFIEWCKSAPQWITSQHCHPRNPNMWTMPYVPQGDRLSPQVLLCNRWGPRNLLRAPGAVQWQHPSGGPWGNPWNAPGFYPFYEELLNNNNYWCAG